MTDIKVTSLAKLQVLVLLHQSPRHGYEIIRKASSALGRPVGAGQVYPFLRALERKGYLAAGKRGQRERKVYSLTPKGRAFVRSLLTRFAEIAEATLASRVRKCAHCGCEIYRGGYQSRGKLYCCRRCAGTRS